jgi:NAD(P)-dependent dehydrogenase (short-subunit alcohol dehydrogenase family)
MANDFDKANILITGAASGTGAAIACLLASLGAKKLILADHDEERLSDFAFSLPCERQLLIGDVAVEALWANADLTGLTHAAVTAPFHHFTDPVADRALDQSSDPAGHPAAGAPQAIADTPFEGWRRVVSANLDGAFLALQAAFRAMSGNGGSIVVTAASTGIAARAASAASGASNAALVELARIAALEGASAGIRVNSIAACPVAAGHDDIAARVAFLLSRDCAGSGNAPLSEKPPFGFGHATL